MIRSEQKKRKDSRSWRCLFILGAVLAGQALGSPGAYGQSDYAFADQFHRNNIEAYVTTTFLSQFEYNLGYERILTAWDYQSYLNKNNNYTAYVGLKIGAGYHGELDSYLLGNIDPGGHVTLTFTAGVVRDPMLPFVLFQTIGFELGMGYFSGSLFTMEGNNGAFWPIITWTSALHFKRIYLKGYAGILPSLGVGIGYHF